MKDQTFFVYPNGDVHAERPCVSPFVYDDVRVSAAEIFLSEKRRDLTKEQFKFWQNVKRKELDKRDHAGE